MKNEYNDLEYSAPSPEYSTPVKEHRPDPDLEFAAPPPEYGQGTRPLEAEEKKRSFFLRNLLIIPLLMMIGTLLFGSGAGKQNEIPGVIPASSETEPARTEPVQSLPPHTEQTRAEAGEPELSAVLEAFPGGEITFTATLLPEPGDGHEYDLRALRMGQHVYWNEEKTGLSLVDDPGAIPITGDKAAGYTLRYEGGSAAASIPEDAQLSVYVVFLDQSTGIEYEIESNRVDAVPPPEPEYPTYPLADGRIVITVYNDTLTFEIPSQVETDDYRTILAMEEIPEAEFTEYSLPGAWTPEGYGFAGWVVHVNNPMDLSSETELFQEYDGDPPVDALINQDNYAFRIYGPLTRDDVERVPPNEAGIRYVNIHAVWIRENPEDIRLVLDDGFGNTSEYGMDSPIASEGYLYLCCYPEPTREGFVFDGWYDEEGNRVDLLMDYFSFTPMLYDESGSFQGYDWNSSFTVRLTAHWRPA